MSGRLRARAVGLIKQLDAGSAGYREIIERELAARAAAGGSQSEAAISTQAGSGRDALAPQPEPAVPALPSCGRCGVLNESDAQFCKQCGNKLID
jgi:hypothetical protein